MHSAFIIFSVLGVLAIILMFGFQFASVGVFTISSSLHNASAAVSSALQGLNSELTNSIPQGPGGPILYYNASRARATIQRNVSHPYAYHPIEQQFHD
jgi:hypothetical protein